MVDSYISTTFGIDLLDGFRENVLNDCCATTNRIRLAYVGHINAMLNAIKYM